MSATNDDRSRNSTGELVNRSFISRNTAQVNTLESRIRKATGGKSAHDLVKPDCRPSSFSKHLLEQLAKIVELTGDDTSDASDMLQEEVSRRLYDLQFGDKKRGGARAQCLTASDARAVVEKLKSRVRKSNAPTAPAVATKRRATPVPAAVVTSGNKTGPGPNQPHRVIRRRLLASGTSRTGLRILDLIHNNNAEDGEDGEESFMPDKIDVPLPAQSPVASSRAPSSIPETPRTRDSGQEDIPEAATSATADSPILGSSPRMPRNQVPPTGTRRRPALPTLATDAEHRNTNKYS